MLNQTDITTANEPTDAHLEQASNYFRLLAEPTRVKILSGLCHGEKTVNSIVDYVALSQANISRHLNMLYRSNILARRKVGTQVYYRINDEKAVDLCRAICRDTVLAMNRCGAAQERTTCRHPDETCKVSGQPCHLQHLPLAEPATGNSP